MKTFTQLGIALSLLLISLSLKAAPIAGGHISYRAIDSVTYVVTAQIFAECDSVNPNVGDSLVVSWSGGGYTSAMTLLSITDVTGSFNKCVVGSGCFITPAVLKIFEHKLIDTVTLPAGICKITFAYADGKRSSIINTGPAGSDFYIHASLNKCNGLNNSAHITFPPQFYIAVGQDAGLSAGYIDTIDGDSLRFNLVSAQTSAVNDIGYSGSWSFTNPLSYLGFPNTGLNHPAGFRLDSLTSQLSFRPTVQNQIAVLTFEAIEYNRVNGVMVEKGRTRLEQTVRVITSPNNKVPKVTGSSITVCAGNQFISYYYADDADNIDSTFVSWNNSIPEGNFSIDNNRLMTASFNWTPKPKDVRNWPHLVTIRVNDNGCIPNGTVSRTIPIFVKPQPDSTLLEVEKKVECNTVTVKFKKPLAAGNFRSVRFLGTGRHISSFNNDSDVMVLFDTGWAKLSYYLTNGTCNTEIYDSVYINPPYKLKLISTPDTTVCPNDSFSLITVPQNGQGPYSYDWPFGDTTQTMRAALRPWQSPAFMDVLVIDDKGCATIDDIVVLVRNPAPPAFGKPDTLCTNDNQQVLPAIPPGGKYYGNGIINNSFFNPDSAGIGFHTLLYAVSDSNGCNVTGTKTIRVLNAPQIPQFTASITAGGVPLSVNFVNQSIGPISKHIWIFTRADGLITDTITSTSSTITKVFNDTGTYHITLINYSGICDASITKNKYITVRSTVGIKPVQNFPFKVYPNPAKDAVIVEGENILLVELTDITGKMIPAVIEKNSNKHLILSPATSGIYLLQITANDGVKVSAKVIFME